MPETPLSIMLAATATLLTTSPDAVETVQTLVTVLGEIQSQLRRLEPALHTLLQQRGKPDPASWVQAIRQHDQAVRELERVSAGWPSLAPAGGLPYG